MKCEFYVGYCLLCVCLCIICSIRTDTVKDEKGNLVGDCNSILARWRNLFSQLFNVHGDNDFMQPEIHTAEPLVPEPSVSEFELAVEKLKRLKPPGIHQIPAERIKAGGRTIYSVIHSVQLHSHWTAVHI